MLRVRNIFWAACLFLLTSCSGPRWQADAEPTVTVLVAQRRISAWTLIQEPEKFFVVQRLPASAGPKTAIATFEEVKGRRLTKSVAEGTFLCADDLIKDEDLKQALL